MVSYSAATERSGWARTESSGAAPDGAWRWATTPTAPDVHHEVELVDLLRTALVELVVRPESVGARG